MAHGYHSSIRDANAKDMPIQKILAAMCGVSMTGKPKILVVQSSRGPRGQDPEEITANEGECHLVEPDTMVIWSTLHGHQSMRGLFIPKLATQIESAHRNDDVYTILNRASRAMHCAPHAHAERILRTSHFGQTPAVASTLTKRFCIKRFAPCPDKAFNISTATHNSSNVAQSLTATEQSEHMSDIQRVPEPELKRSKILTIYRVITWNLNGAAKHRLPPQRLESAKTKIKDRIPDAVLLQEVPKRLLDDLMKEFLQYKCVSQITQNTDFYMVTLLKQDKFKITEEHCIPDNRFLATKATDCSNGSTWVIVNCHLKATVKKKPKSDKDFAKQRSKTLEDVLQKLGSSKIEVIIIGGDMNIAEGETSDQCLINAEFKDAWISSPLRVRNKYPYTMNQKENATFQFDTALFGNDSEPYEPARFDRIYIKSPTHFSVDNYMHFGMESEVLHDAPGLLVAKAPCSDHYGVAIELLIDK